MGRLSGGKLPEWLLLLILLIWGSSLSAQSKRDARSLALGGAYTLLSRGYMAVGYNPANLAYSHDYSFYLGISGINLSFSNNVISLERYNLYNGRDLEKNNARLKNQFLNSIPDNGWRIFSDFDYSLPFLNYSSGNMAFTSDLVFLMDIGIPKSLIQILFKENEIDKVFDLSLMEDLLVVGEYSYSVAIPFESYALGFTLKYLQGIAYIGINPDSSQGEFITSGVVSAKGQYLLEQAVGGMGVALDLGLTIPPSQNGWGIGVSLINLMGRIYWKKNTFSSRYILKKDMLPFEGQYYRYSYSLNDINGYKLFEMRNDTTPLFEGKAYTFEDSTSLRTIYPTLFRFGVTKALNPEVIFAGDLVAGFTDRFFAFGRWQLSLGLEFIRFPTVPVRVGVSIGGKNMQMFTMGSGLHRGFFHLDWAIGFRQGIWLHTARGFYFSVNLYLTGRRIS